MKYLPRFKWSNLTEKLAYDSAVRKKKLQQEVTQVRKETNFYLEQVDKNKQVTAIKRKREEKQKSDTSKPSTDNLSNNTQTSSLPATKQRKLADSENKRKSISILSSVFTQ